VNYLMLVRKSVMAAAVFPLFLSATALAANIPKNVLQHTDNFKVVSADGELNCRSDPGIKFEIKRVYRTNDIIIPWDDRNFDKIAEDENGNPWLGTIDFCYVRADTRYIEPQHKSPYESNGEITPSFAQISFRWRAIAAEDSLGNMRGLNCRVGRGSEYAVRDIVPKNQETYLVAWTTDSRDRVWVAIPEGDSKRPRCWLRGTQDCLMILEY